MQLRILSAGLAIGALSGTLTAQNAPNRGEWRSHGADAASTRYAALDQITHANVGKLRIAWRRPAVDASLLTGAPDLSYSSDFRATPLMIDGVLYASNGIGLVEAFHPGTGKTIWVQQPFPDEPNRGLTGVSTRAI